MSASQKYLLKLLVCPVDADQLFRVNGVFIYLFSTGKCVSAPGRRSPLVARFSASPLEQTDLQTRETSGEKRPIETFGWVTVLDHFYSRMHRAAGTL